MSRTNKGIFFVNISYYYINFEVSTQYSLSKVNNQHISKPITENFLSLFHFNSQLLGFFLSISSIITTNFSSKYFHVHHNNKFSK